jgi:hypothetical protein
MLIRTFAQLSTLSILIRHLVAMEGYLQLEYFVDLKEHHLAQMDVSSLNHQSNSSDHFAQRFLSKIKKNSYNKLTPFFENFRKFVIRHISKSLVRKI